MNDTSPAPVAAAANGQQSDSADGSDATAVVARSAAFVAVDGDRVAYSAYGDPDGVPVVFFHGTPGSRLLGGLYHDRARALGVRLLAFDRPGYGRSEPRPDYEPSDSAAVFSALLDDVGAEQAGVAAFSGGAPHALAAAAARPELVCGVDVVSGGVPASLRETTPAPQRLLGALASSTPRLLGGLLRGQAWAARKLPPSFVVAQYTSGDGEDAVPEDEAALVRRDFLEALAEHRGGVVRESRQFTADWTVSPAAVDSAVRWWHGENDDNSPVDAAERLAAEFPDCDLRVLPDTDHLGALLATRRDVLARYATGE